MRVRFLLPLATVVVAAGSSPALAATPIPLGPAGAIDVAVDPLGAAHVVATNPDSGELRYCLIPRGVGGCTRQSTIPMPGNGHAGAAHIQLAGSTVYVTGVRTGAPDTGPAVAVSHDGGQSFSPGVRTASDDGLWDGQQTLGPDNGLWHAYSSSRLWAVRLATDGSSPTSDWQVEFDDAYSAFHDGGIAFVGSTAVAARAGEQPAFFTHTIGGGNPNLRAGWSGPNPIARSAGSEWMSAASLASGSRGAVMTATEGAGLTAAITARRWTGSGFGPAVELYRHSGGSNNAANGEVAADANGGLHAVYAGDNESYVRYSYSADGGASWGPSHLIEAVDRGAPVQLRVSAAPDAQGFAAYTRRGEAMVVPLEPIAPPSDAIPVIEPGPPAPPAPPVKTTPTPPKRKTTTTKVRVGDSDLVLGLPSGCLAPGNVRVTFKVQARKVKKAKHRKGRVVVKVRSVVFSVDGKRRKTDRKAAFVQTLRLQGLKPGTTHVVRARAELKQKQQGPKRYRTVTRKVKICA